MSNDYISIWHDLLTLGVFSQMKPSQVIVFYFALPIKNILHYQTNIQYNKYGDNKIIVSTNKYNFVMHISKLDYKYKISLSTEFNRLITKYGTIRHAYHIDSIIECILKNSKHSDTIIRISI